MHDDLLDTYTRPADARHDAHKLSLLVIQLDALIVRVEDDARDLHDDKLAADITGDDVNDRLRDAIADLKHEIARREESTGDEYAAERSMFQARSGVVFGGGA